MAKNKGGRPPIPPKQRRATTRAFRVTAEESKLLDKAARAKGKPPTQWMREVLVKSAKAITGRRG